jgi:hypothetical protein
MRGALVFDFVRTRARASIWLAAAALACGSAAPVAKPLEPRAVQRPAAPQIAAAAVASARCVPDFIPYVPPPASSVAVRLPAVPELPQRPIKVGDAYSVWGAGYLLRSEVHRAEVSEHPVTIQGYISKTNLLEAPRCAVHASDKADPTGCRAPAPAFWLSDAPHADPKDSIKVLGWASNYAQVYEAIKLFDLGTDIADRLDEALGVRLQNPLPAVGAKVSVTGTYGTTFVMNTSDAEADIVMGLLTYQTMQYLEAAPELARLPGVRRASRPR